MRIIKKNLCVLYTQQSVIIFFEFNKLQTSTNNANSTTKKIYDSSREIFTLPFIANRISLVIQGLDRIKLLHFRASTYTANGN